MSVTEFTLTAQMRQYLDMIASKEAINNSYDSRNPNRIDTGLSTRTIGAIINGGPGARGRYQFMPDTLKDIINNGSIAPNGCVPFTNRSLTFLPVLKSYLSSNASITS